MSDKKQDETPQPQQQAPDTKPDGLITGTPGEQSPEGLEKVFEDPAKEDTAKAVKSKKVKTEEEIDPIDRATEAFREAVQEAADHGHISAEDVFLHHFLPALTVKGLQITPITKE